jgi:hypothetical protein
MVKLGGTTRLAVFVAALLGFGVHLQSYAQSFKTMTGLVCRGASYSRIGIEYYFRPGGTIESRTDMDSYKTTYRANTWSESDAGKVIIRGPDGETEIGVAEAEPSGTILLHLRQDGGLKSRTLACNK